MGTPIIFDKPFKTYDEQLAHLRDDYGLEIGDPELAKYILSTYTISTGKKLAKAQRKAEEAMTAEEKEEALG